MSSYQAYSSATAQRQGSPAPSGRFSSEGPAPAATSLSSPAHPQRTLAPLAAQTTRENPWPLSLLNSKIKTYVDKMSALWVEGQVVEYKPRPGTKMAFFVLRDADSDVSMPVSTFPGIIDAAGVGFEEGTRVVARVKPVFWERRGTLNLRADEIHVQGIGDLLAHIEKLRRKLAAEGLFADSRKVALPFLPHTIGLICGRNAKAKDDVIVNASARWPAVRFEIREVAVQGEYAVREVSAAIAELDSLPHVEVIVVARGGGSVEDLLPFSEEVMVRAAANCATPLVSAIGHEADAPLLDLVADYRASTPTDAARRIVPDRTQELQGLSHAVSVLRSAMGRRLSSMREELLAWASRPVLAHPSAAVEGHRMNIDIQRTQLRQIVHRRLSATSQELAAARATLTAISPQATLERGYALLQLPSGELIRSASQIPKGQLIEGILAEGRMVAQVVGSTMPQTTDSSSSSSR